MTHEEFISLIKTYGVTEEKAKEIAEKTKDKNFFIGKWEVKPKDYYILGVDLADKRGEE